MIAAITVTDAVVRLALSQLHVREIGGANAGPDVEAYQRVTGNKRGDPWCASFVAWCGKRMLGAEWPLALTASCQALYEDALRQGFMVETPARGDVALVWYPSKGRYAHTMFVTKAHSDRSFATVEGNTSDPKLPATREGWGVFERVRGTRADTARYAFARWHREGP